MATLCRVSPNRYAGVILLTDCVYMSLLFVFLCIGQLLCIPSFAHIVVLYFVIEELQLPCDFLR
uniref:Uncharacterized protein n=1 Tax=Manihot esculenta TaxID=3983 RepID=A0A2C9V1E9_MANES